MTGLIGLTSGSIFADDYRVLRPIAGGGMGAVYAVEQRSTGHLRALKLMHPHLVQDAALRERFEQEAKVGARIASDHIVQVIAAGVDGPSGMPWLAMEMLEGESLLARGERRGALPPGEVAEIVRQLGHALGAAHAAGVVHRDLKPENLFISEARRSGASIVVKVLDFGIAKVVADAQPAATAPMGTLAWMAPEQTEAGATIAPSADVWSLGLLAFWMLTGKSYWRSAGGDMSAPKLIRELLVEPLSPASVRAREVAKETELPPSFDGWFRRCVVREPGARFREGAEACAALLEILGEKNTDLAPRRGGAELAVTQVDPSNMDRASSGGPTPSPSSSAEMIDPSLTPTVPVEPSAPSRATLPKTWGRSALKLTLSLSALALLLLVVWMRWIPASSPPPIAPAPPAPRPTAITDLPPPRSTSPQALSAYAAALQSFRDANWAQGMAGLEEALRHDPSLAAAHLRIAWPFEAIRVPELRPHYALAMRGRASLDERDQAVLHAISPIYAQDSSNFKECRARLELATERYPLDAELFMLLGTACEDSPHRDDDLDALFHAVELDPDYADAWSGLAIRLSDMERLDEAVQAADRCLSISPTSTDCLTQRAGVHRRRGHCAEMEADLRRALNTGAKLTDWTYDEWISSLYALGKPKETILEALRQKWSLEPEPSRGAVEALDRAELDVAEGRFDEAEGHLLQGMKGIHADPSEQTHSRFARELIALYRESGQLDRAARVAADYLKRKDAWQSSSRDSTDLMLHTMAHGGMLSKKELAGRLSSWIEQNNEQGRKLTVWEAWAATHSPDGNREALEEAIAAVHDDMGPPPSRLLGRLGKIYVRLDMHGRALPLLREAARPCRRPDPEGDLLVAKALEGTGDKAGACEMYTKVVDRWGGAKPRSLTAAEARARARTACAAR